MKIYVTVKFPKLSTETQHTISIIMKHAIAVERPFLNIVPSKIPVITPSMSSIKKKKMFIGVDSASGIMTSIPSKFIPIGIRLMHIKYKNEFVAQ